MTAEQGRRFWDELHLFAWTYPEVAAGAEQEMALAWLAEFARRLREAAGRTCPCADEWDFMVAAVPPPLQGWQEFFMWTVAAHDRVNVRLGKRMLNPAWSTRHLLFRPRKYLSAGTERPMRRSEAPLSHPVPTRLKPTTTRRPLPCVCEAGRP
jgi:hypothetical protein